MDVVKAARSLEVSRSQCDLKFQDKSPCDESEETLCHLSLSKLRYLFRFSILSYQQIKIIYLKKNTVRNNF